MPNRRAASRRLIPSTYPARRTCPYSSTPFIPPPSAHLGRRPSIAGFLLRRRRSIRPLFEGFFHRRSQYDPKSPNFHHFLTQQQIADDFGPSRADFESVFRWMISKGFRVERGSVTRL